MGLTRGMGMLGLATAVSLGLSLGASPAALGSSKSWYEGQDGYPGHDGQSITVIADGRPGVYDLSGTDGGSGTPGSTGTRGRCGYRGSFGTPGGNGGDGGNGGNGGNGGDITVHYADLSSLRHLLVISRPGHGGWGAQGGPGGSGCSCTKSDEHDENEDGCSSSSDGFGGRNGRDGSDGVPGSAYLVNRREPLEPVSPTAQLPITSLDSNPQLELSRHLWTSHDGALALFAPGSYLQDRYFQYDRLARRKVRISWEAGRPASGLGTSPASLRFDDAGVTLDLPYGVLAKTDQVEQDGVTVIRILKVIREDEARQLAYGNLVGTDQNLVLELKDPAGVSSFVKTGADLEYSTISFLFYNTRFEGSVPAELISCEDNAVRIALGKLPIKGKFLKDGKKIRVRLRLSRTLGDHRAWQNLELKLRVGKGPR